MKDEVQIQSEVAKAMASLGSVDNSELSGEVFECDLNGAHTIVLINERTPKAYNLGRYSFSWNYIENIVAVGAEFIAIVPTIGRGTKIINLRQDKPTITFDEFNEAIKTYKV
jgi:hypothetical protein